MRFLLLLLLLFGGSSAAFTQNNINGTLQDDAGQPVPFGNVILTGGTQDFFRGEVADLDGKFLLTNLPAGEYVLTVSAIGFQDTQRTILIDGDQNLGIITIATDAIALEEVTVTAQKVAFQRQADRTIVNVGSLPTAAGGNALELLERSPTVNVDRVSSDISLLGRNNVMVYINGKRTRLTGNELVQYLASIPAASIASLELINNPPVSYDADGTGGVVNIVLKNYESDGLNGSVSAFAGYGQRGKYGGAAVFNYQRGRWNVYGDLSNAQDYTFQNSDITSSIQFDNGIVEAVQDSYRPAFLSNSSVKLGTAYVLGDKTTVDIFGAYARRRWELTDAETRTTYAGELAPFPTDLLAGDETNTTNQYTLSTHLQHRLAKQHALSFDYDYLNFNIVNPTAYQLTNFDTEGVAMTNESFTTRKETPFDFHVARSDYQWEGEKLRIEAGVKATFSSAANTTLLNNGQQDPALEELFTDETQLSERIYAAYYSLRGQWGEHLSYTGGLRYEYYDLELAASRADLDRTISRVFPSVSLTHTISPSSQLTLAYRERISRPGFGDLAPAFFFFNPYTVLAGNIQVMPNINRTSELTFNHQRLFIALSYSLDDAPLVQYAIPQLNQAENLLLLLSDNIDQRQQLGLNVSFPFRFSDVWSSNYQIGSYWRRDEMTFGEVKNVISNPFLSIDVAQNFELPKQWYVALSGRWNSTTYRGTISQPAQSFVHLGVQKKLSNSTVGLSWTDIFNTGSFLGFNNNLAELGIAYEWLYDLEGSILKLSYSYQFGGRKVKQQRGSGATEVLQRTGS
ncbi:MAG: outer membrane beta-barrel protein [Bacteroidota bacterium]